MLKSEVIKYLNANTKGRKAGRKEFRINDIFISSSSDKENFRLTSFGSNILAKHFKEYRIPIKTDAGMKLEKSGKMVLILDRYLNSPYYSSRAYLKLYEESVAAQISLIGLEDWVEAKDKISKIN